jgi:superfamily II DNA helicase RecQ
VFHVAITRAREELVIVSTDTPSPFIEELRGPPATAPLGEPTLPRHSTATTAAARLSRGVTAVVGMVLVDGGQEWTVEAVDGTGSLTRRGSATRRFDYGMRVRTSSGRQGPLLPAAADDDSSVLLIEERLRVMRHELRDGKPAYTVFPDSTLVALARERPTTRAALLQIEGIGPARADRYGEAILEALREPAGS